MTMMPILPTPPGSASPDPELARREWLTHLTGKLGSWSGPLLALGWALNNLRWARVFGWPHVVADSRARYLPYAHAIAERGYFAPGHDLRYVGYPLWLSAWLRLGAGPTGAAWGQLVLAGLAALAFYFALRRLTHRRTIALLGTAALVLWPDTQEFNGFILTESLAASGLIFTFAALVRARDATRLASAWVVAAVAALLTASLRPNAFVVPLGLALAGLVVVAGRYGAARVRWAALVGAALLAPVLWWGLNKLLLTFTLIETYAAASCCTVTPRGPSIPPSRSGFRPPIGPRPCGWPGSPRTTRCSFCGWWPVSWGYFSPTPAHITRGATSR